MADILGGLFDPTDSLAVQAGSGGLCPYRYPDGTDGWLITGNALAKSVLADLRFSSRAEVKCVPVPRDGAEPFFGRPTLPGWFIDMDPPRHATFRKRLAGYFTMHRLEARRTVIEQIVDECLADVRGAGRPADLIRHFAIPVPLRVIGALLGVPKEELPTLETLSETLFSLASSAAQSADAMDRLTDLFRDLVLHARSHPGGTDVLSTLSGESEFSVEDLAGAAVLLLTAGHETTASMLGLSTLHLLTRPGLDGGDLLAPERVGDTVEELLRYLTILHLGVARGATRDIELAGQTIKAGEHVTVALPAANHDPGHFTDPKGFDPGRGPRGHIAFGYGVHQCIGQNLARLELRIGLTRLFERFPGLGLAIDPRDVDFFRRGAVYGISSLPLTWSDE